MSNFKNTDVLIASTNVKNFTEKEGQLPNFVTISGKKYSMEQYMFVSSDLVRIIREGGSHHDLGSWIEKFKVDKPKVQAIKADIDKKTYYDMNDRVYSFFMKNRKAPSSVSSKYGNVQYQAYIYSNAKILNYYRVHKIMPNYVSLNLAKNSKILNYLPKY